MTNKPDYKTIVRQILPRTQHAHDELRSLMLVEKAHRGYGIRFTMAYEQLDELRRAAQSALRDEREQKA